MTDLLCDKCGAVVGQSEHVSVGHLCAKCDDEVNLLEAIETRKNYDPKNLTDDDIDEVVRAVPKEKLNKLGVRFNERVQRSVDKFKK